MLRLLFHWLAPWFFGDVVGAVLSSLGLLLSFVLSFADGARVWHFGVVVL